MIVSLASGAMSMVLLTAIAAIKPSAKYGSGARLRLPAAVRAARGQRAQHHHHRREHDHARELGDGGVVAGLFPRLIGRGDDLGDLVHGGAGPETVVARGETEQQRQQGIEHHRDHAAERDAGDRVGAVFFGRLGDVLAAMTADAPQIDVPAAISSVSLASTPSAAPSGLVTTKQAISEIAMTARPVAPTSSTCCVVSWKPKSTIAKRRIQRSENATPGLAASGRAERVVEKCAERDRDDHRAERGETGDSGAAAAPPSR